MRTRAKRPRLEDFDDLGQAEPSAGRLSEVKRKSVAGGDPAIVQRLHDAVRPCLSTVLQIHGLKRERKPPPETAQPHMRELLTTTMSRLEALSIPHEELQDLRYGLVAFIDEFMQAEPGRLRDFWQANLLQLEFFGETRAGEGFFERLEQAKQDNRVSVLRVYYLCLLFGFQGIYGQHGELERENLIEGLKQLLGQREGLAPALSPHGARPDEAGVDRTRNRLLQWLAVAAASMAVIWYFGLLFTIDAQEHTLSEDLQGAYEDVKAGVVSPNH